MQDAPDQVLTALKSGYRLAVRADVLSRGVVVRSDVKVTGGPVVSNRQQFARRTATVTIIDKTLVPTGDADDLLTLGNEIRLWRGMSHPYTWRTPLITGVIVNATVNYDESGVPVSTTVDLIDRCTRITDARFPYPVNVSGSAQSALISLVQGSVTDWTLPVAFDGSIVDVQLPPQTFQRDRDDAVKQIAAALGAEPEATGLGEIRFQPIPDPSGEPDMPPIEGGDGGLLISGSKSFSRDGVYNGIIAIGNSVGSAPAPTSDLIVDSDPTSPTFWDGPFGHKPGFLASSLLTSKDQANRAAVAQLRNTVGLARSVSFTAVPHPGLEVGDLVGVRWPDGSYEQHIVDTLKMPLNESDPMTASTRATQIVGDVS